VASPNFIDTVFIKDSESGEIFARQRILAPGIEFKEAYFWAPIQNSAKESKVKGINSIELAPKSNYAVPAKKKLLDDHVCGQLCSR
jgi:hypothetical protein